MIKILSTTQLHEADKITIEKQGISSIDLMERASLKCTEWIDNHFNEGFEYYIFCGKGNNGGDGLAIARLLYLKGKKLKVYLVGEKENASADFLINYLRVEKLNIKITGINDASAFPSTNANTIIIDAIFGSGLNRELGGLFSEFASYVNKLSNTIIAIDTPSGLFADKKTENISNVVNADFTLTFQSPKKAFLFPEYESCAGKWVMLDIGLDKDFIAKTSGRTYMTEPDDLKELLKPRSAFGHKGTFGHALLLAGSYGKSGAAVLTVNACLRSGVGLVTARTPACSVIPLQTKASEAMLIPDDELNFLSASTDTGKYSAIGIGPAIGMEKATGNVLKGIIQDAKALVLDADALNILAENPTWLSFLPAQTILTPHIGEFRRLAGNINDSFSVSEAQLEFSRKYNCYVLLKGKYSALACPDGTLIFNSTGNSGMATGGSGDVLTGLLTGLLAQGYSAFQAGLIGMFLHGKAGDLAAEELSEEALKAGDIINYLEKAFKSVRE